MSQQERLQTLAEAIESSDSLVDRLLNPSPDERFVFIFGSAVTAPVRRGEPGVPGVRGIVEMIRKRLPAKARSSLDAEIKQHPDGNHYQFAIAAMRREPNLGQKAVNLLFRDVVLGCISRKGSITLDPRQCDDDGNFLGDPELVDAAWVLPPAAAAVGEIVMVGGRRYGADILTTNFDPLLGVSIARAGGHYFRVSMSHDGFINAMSGTVPRIVHLHGFWFPPETLHSPEEISSPRRKIEASLFWILKGATVVVMGYGGWDDALMRYLRKASAGVGSTRIIWCFRESSRDEVVKATPHVLQHLDLGIEDGRVELYGGVDVHVFLPHIAQSISDKEALLRGALSHYVSEAFEIDTDATKGYWAAIGSVMPNMKQLVEHEFKITHRKLRELARAFDDAALASAPVERARQVVRHLIQSRSGSWARVDITSPTFEALQLTSRSQSEVAPDGRSAGS